MFLIISLTDHLFFLLFYLPAILGGAWVIDYLQYNLIGEPIGIGGVPAIVDLIAIRLAYFGHLVLANETQLVGTGASRPTILQTGIVDSAIVFQGLAVGDKMHIANNFALTLK